MNTCRQALIRTPNLFRLKQVPIFYSICDVFYFILFIKEIFMNILVDKPLLGLLIYFD